MTPQEIREHAIAFLGHMLTRPEVMTELHNAPEPQPGQGKSASAVGDIIAKHLNIPKPSDDEVRQMAKHIQDATASVKTALEQHAPQHATTFSPSHFCIY